MSPADQRPSQLGLAKARDQLGELVRRVSEDGEVLHLARRGRRVATLIAPHRLAALEESAVDFGRLADVTQALITTLDVHTALDRLVHVVTGWLGTACIVDLVEDGQWECTAADIRPPMMSIDAAGLQAAVGTDGADAPVLPGTRRFTSHEPVVGRWGKMLTVLGADEAIGAPLVRGDRVFGALIVVPTESPDERVTRLTDEVARRASVVVDNGRFYAEQRTVAERFQRYLLAELPAVPGLRLAARYASAPRAPEVGGDWYDAFALPDGALAVVIGDVMGHDLDAAVHMSQLRNLLRAVAWIRPADPAAIIAELDRICAGLDFGPEVLATVVVGVLERVSPTAWRWRWSNAGHMPPMLLEAGRDPNVLERRPDAVLCSPATAEARVTHELELQAPATLFFYTDGLIERRSERLERSLTKLRRTVQKLPFDDPDQLLDGLVAGVEDHDDDIALLAVHITS